MKNYYILFILLFLPYATLQSQHKESSNILEKLKWDDEMLNIMIDMRVDYQADFDRSGWQDGSFQAQTFKLWFAGEITEGVRYRIRQRLNKPQTPLREGYSGATDQAWLAFDFAKRWTVTVGKQSVQFGTFEYDYNPADIYLPTMCFNDLDAYKTGVNLAYNVAGQVFNFQVVNSDATQFADSAYSNKGVAFNLLWQGKLFDGLLNTRWAYGAFQHDKGNFLNWVTLGLQLNINKITTELDYYTGTRYMDYSSVVDIDNLGLKKVFDQSAALNLKYEGENWKPSVKFVWNDRFDKDLGQDAYRNWGISTVMEYYPFQGKLKDLRFHLMYAYNDTNFEGPYTAEENQYQSTILGGIRWLFKVK